MARLGKAHVRLDRVRFAGRRIGWLSVPVLFVVVATACGGSNSSGLPPRVLVAEVASFDLAADHPQRFFVGLFSASRGEVTFGSVDLSFQLLSDDARPDGGPGATSAGFIALPGSETNPGDSPTFEAPVYARGVYGTAPITFDAPGFWEVTIDAVVDGEAMTTTAAFEVRTEPLVLIPGDPAPPASTPPPSNPAPNSMTSCQMACSTK